MSEIVFNLFLFESQLLVIREHLPFATTAGAEMSARGDHTVRRRCADSQQVGLGIAVFSFVYLHIDEITWHGVRHKDCQAVQFGDSLALRSGGDDFQIFYVISFKSHSYLTV